MPISPSPGRGLEVSGLDKTTGWGSRTGTGELILGHEADQGINHLAGLSEGGMDTSTAPFVRTLASTGIAATTCTVNWSTAPSSPAGSIKYRLAGTGGAYTTVAESAGNKTAHAIPLTGLVAAKTYEYTITQPSPVAGVTGVTVQFSGRFHTTGGTMEDPEGTLQERLGEPIRDTSGITDSKDLLKPQVGPGREQLTPPFKMNNLKVEADVPGEVVVQWRTDVYADGTVMYRPVGGESSTADELGVKRLNHSVTLGGLKPDTEYEVAVISADAQGNTANAGPARVRTLAP